jgi:ABC-type transporter Mla subunit MlaD
MAKKTHNEVAVGITVLVALALTIYIVVMLADWSSIWTPEQKITVKLPYRVGLKGLTEGSPVLLGGVKIGSVTKTEIKKLSPTEADSNDVYVFFTMKIPQEYQLRYDCVLLPQSNLLGGQPLLSIEDLGSKGEVIKDGEVVELELADSVMEAIKHEFDSADPESLLSLLRYEVNRDNNDSIVTSLKNVTAELEKTIPSLRTRINQTLAKAESTLDTAQLALQDAREFISDERIDKILNNVTRVSTNLKLTSQEVRRAPWKLLYKPKENEFEIQALVDSAGSFAAGAESLENSVVRLRALIATADDKQPIDKDKLGSMIAELETSFNKFQEAEQKFWEELK